MADNDRDPNDFVQLKIRCREHLRAQLELEADKAGHTLTKEIVRRLEKSVADDARQRSEDAMHGGWKTARLCDEVTKAIRFFGVDCSTEEEPLMREVLIGAITQILTERLPGYGGLMSNPSSVARRSDEVTSIPGEIAERGRARGAMIGHHITLATRAAEQEDARADHDMQNSKGETLFDAAVRLGLLSHESPTALATKKPKKRAEQQE